MSTALHSVILILGNGLQDLQTLEWWRLCFFLATLAPICWATSLAMRLLVVAVESKLSIAKNTLYFLAAVKVTLLLIAGACAHSVQ